MSGSELRPNDLADARDAMLEAAKANHTVLIRGAGTAQTWGAAVDDVDVVLDTTGLDQLVAYNPADMTVAVGAGMPLLRLQSELAEQGQRIALDAARIPDGATVGGLLATADAGPLRRAYGSLRDLVIGATMVLADGMVARSGGHVIKNVAGYDLAKLLSGSLGTLGLATEVVLRVHPRPEATRTIAVPCDAAGAFSLASELFASPLEPVSAEWQSVGDASGRVLIRLEGTEAGLAHRVDQTIAIVDKAGLAGVERLDDEAGQTAWSELAAAVGGVDGDTVLRAGTRPDRLPALANRLYELAADSAVTATLTSCIGAGVHTVRLSGGTAEEHAALVRQWRADARAEGGSVTPHRRTDGLDELLPAWGKPPAAVDLLRSVKRQLDPDNRLGPGRFAPWL